MDDIQNSVTSLIGIIQSGSDNAYSLFDRELHRFADQDENWRNQLFTALSLNVPSSELVDFVVRLVENATFNEYLGNALIHIIDGLRNKRFVFGFGATAQ